MGSFKEWMEAFLSIVIMVSPVIHLGLIFALPFIYFISVEEGLEWDAHIMYGSFHLVIFLLHVFVICMDPLRIANMLAVAYTDFKVPQTFEYSGNNICCNLGIALVLSVNSQILLFDNYTDVIFLATVASDEQYIEFFAISLTVFCIYWVLKIWLNLWVCCFTQAWQGTIDNSKAHSNQQILYRQALLLLETEIDIFPLLPKWLYECLTCQKSLDNENEEYKGLYAKMITQISQKPLKAIRFGFEDISQSIIQLCFCIMVDSSLISWVGAVLSLLMCIKNGKYIFIFTGCIIGPCVDACKDLQESRRIEKRKNYDASEEADGINVDEEDVDPNEANSEGLELEEADHWDVNRIEADLEMVSPEVTEFKVVDYTETEAKVVDHTEKDREDIDREEIKVIDQEEKDPKDVNLEETEHKETGWQKWVGNLKKKVTNSLRLRN